MYPVGATISDTVDNVFMFIIIASVILLLIVTGLMIWFAFKYNRKRHPEPKPVKESIWLEVVWTLIPTILVLAMFYYGYEGFKYMREVPDDAMVVKVEGRMWEWKFEYANGKRTKELHVPVNKPVKLLMKSFDVVHSFYIPSERVKEDVVPGRETYLWFKPQTVGPADIFCAEFCGQRHAYMLSKLIVMEEDEFQKWYASGIASPKPKPLSPTLKLMTEIGCMECHTMGKSKEDMLTLKGIFGQKRDVISSGRARSLLVDEAYIKRSILEPGADIVKGQDNSMLKLELGTDISIEQLEQIVRFLVSGKDPVPESPGKDKTATDTQKNPSSDKKTEEKK